MPEEHVEHVEHPEPERSIRRAIADHGPISFAEFMELALYGPGGFYEEPPVGERRHFVTSPHVHPVFGRCVAEAVRECWAHFGGQRPMSLVEVGAGDGTLARQILRHLEAVPLAYTAVERSPGARLALSGIQPHIRVAASLEALDQHVEGVILANELLDNLPFRWLRRDDGGDLFEILVTLRDDRLAIEARTFREDDEEEQAVADSIPPGSESVIPVGALHFVERLARALHRGYALLIDYASGPLAEVHGYRSQRVVEDVVTRPGSADVTAGVDFRALSGRAEALGMRSYEPVTQRSALIALGYERWSIEERRRQAEALDRRSGREAVAAWSGRNAAAQLVSDRALGRLRWWLLATPGMPEPHWLRDASARDVTDAVSVRNEETRGFMTFEVRRRRWWERAGGRHDEPDPEQMWLEAGGGLGETNPN